MLESWFPLGMSHYLAGGLLIGAGVSLLYLSVGLIGGTSSVFTTWCSYFSRRPFFQQPVHLASRNWRSVYALGLIIGVALALWLSGQHSPLTAVSDWRLLLGGFIAGFGARLGQGCTSGHGICGIASLSPMSLSAVLVFLAAAIITAQLMQAGGW